jgi:hypothetical protein
MWLIALEYSLFTVVESTSNKWNMHVSIQNGRKRDAETEVFVNYGQSFFPTDGLMMDNVYRELGTSRDGRKMFNVCFFITAGLQC